MFKYIKAALIICLSLYPVYAGQLQSSEQFKNSGGLIDHISPLLIPDGNASSVQNITMDDRGQLSKRGGYSILDTTGTMGTNAVTGGAYHNAASGASFFGLVVGTNVYQTGNTFNGTYTNVTGTVTITAASTNFVQTASLNDRLVFCNESDMPFQLQSTGNAVRLNTTVFTNAKSCATYGVYLIAANTTESGVSFPSRVRWSDINNPDVFPVNNYIDVEPNDGDKIVSIISFEDSVYIFKKRSIHRVVITGLDGADAFIIRPIARNIGAWAKNSVKTIPGQGIFFLAQNTVYQLSNTSSDEFSGNGLRPIGDPIQRTFDGITRTMWSNAVAGVYPKRYQYWLAVSTTSDSQNHEVLVYDYIQKAWTVYTNISINALSQAEDSNGNNILLSGDYTGNLYKQDNGTSDNPGNVSSAIPASYTTADLTFNTPEITKGFKYLYIFSQVDVNTTVTVQAAFDYSSSYEFSQGVDLGQAGALYDTAIYDTDIYPAIQYKVSRIELNRSARSIKLKLSNSSSGSIVGIIGWTVVYSLEDYRQ